MPQEADSVKILLEVMNDKNVIVFVMFQLYN